MFHRPIAHFEYYYGVYGSGAVDRGHKRAYQISSFQGYLNEAVLETNYELCIWVRKLSLRVCTKQIPR